MPVPRPPLREIQTNAAKIPRTTAKLEITVITGVDAPTRPLADWLSSRADGSRPVESPASESGAVRGGNRNPESSRRFRLEGVTITAVGSCSPRLGGSALHSDEVEVKPVISHSQQPMARTQRMGARVVPRGLRSLITVSHHLRDSDTKLSIEDEDFALGDQAIIDMDLDRIVAALFQHDHGA